MLFNKHSELEGRHAFLSPSQPAWMNYDLQKLEARFHSWKAAKRGTDLHNLAHEAVRLGVQLHSDNESLATYVADAIEFGMTCEQPLYYSEHCFGCADALAFHDDFLRIHDLKTGITPTKMRQLKGYAALFCLEYGFNPFDIQIELRIYQRENMEVEIPNPEEIAFIMETIVTFDNYIETEVR